MTELQLGTGEDSSDSNSGSSGGGGGDIVDTLEKMQGFLMENPQMAKAFGIDLGEIDMGVEGANEAVESGEGIDHNFLSDLLNGVEENGFGEKTISEVREWVDNNPQMVNEIIEENT